MIYVLVHVSYDHYRFQTNIAASTNKEDLYKFAETYSDYGNPGAFKDCVNEYKREDYGILSMTDGEIKYKSEYGEEHLWIQEL